MDGPAFAFSIYLAQQRRRSVHTVRAYRTAAVRKKRKAQRAARKAERRGRK